MDFRTWWESEERDADWYLPILAESAWNAALASGYTADARLMELLEAAHSELQWWAAQDIEEPACVTATLDRLNDALMLVRSNAKSQATEAASSRQVACTDGLGVAVPPAPTFERAEMRKAPWKDYAGNDIYEGDRIQHPDGTTGTVVFFEFEPDPSDKWRVLYDDGDRDKEWAARISRLCLQIGDKGQAVVTPNTNSAECAR